MSWASGPLVGFDTETTGVNVAEDRVVTAAVVFRDETGTHEATWLIDPGVEIPERASAIHGITTEMARANGQSPAEALPDIADTLVESLAAGFPVVAFNAAYDLMILDADLRRHGLPTLAERLGREVSPVIDPLVMDRALERYRKGKRTLTDLCRVYGIAASEDMHTAEVDVAATLDLLTAMAAKHGEVAAMTAPELHAWQVTAHRAWAEDFNGWMAKNGRTGRADVTWPYPA